MTIQTERLILRELTSEDFSAMYGVLADSDIMQHYPYTFDENRVWSWIACNQNRYRIFGFGLWAVTLKSTGEVIGDCGLTMQNINGVIAPEIGYHIAKKHQRQGYAGEAARKCRDWTFQNTPFNVIYSYMEKSNIPSARTAMSNGMKLTGEYDHDGVTTCVYSITRSEWEKLT